MKQCHTSAVPSFNSLVDLALYRADLHPDRPAYVFLTEGELEENSVTYGGLIAQAQRIAALLQDRGGEGQPVLLAYEPGLDFVIAFWGCLLARSIAVPVYAPRGAQRANGLHAITQDSGSRLALTHEPYQTNLSRVLDQFPSLRRVAWLNTDIDLPSQADFSFARNPHPTAVLQYTSGSTGRPKGVQISHTNVLCNEEAIRIAFGHNQNSVIINCLPHFHDMGLFGNLLQPFYLGALCVSMAPAAFVQKPSRLLTAITHYHGTTCGGPNFVYALCADKMPAAELDLNLSSWDVAYIGAERIRPEVQRRFCKKFEPYGFRKESFLPCYGLAEATLCVSAATRSNSQASEGAVVPAPAAREERVVSCGIAVGDQAFLIVDPVTREICRESHEGEVWLQGCNVSQGYWQNEPATKETFHAFTADGRGPFLRTGDCGYTTEEELFISGRLSGFIIVDGENFHAEDLEIAVADAHPAIRGGRCMAIPMEAEGREEFVLLAEVARAYMRNFDSKSPAEAILKKLTGQHGLTPRTIVFVRPGGVPCTPNGKLSRQAGRQAYSASALQVLSQWQRTAPTVQQARDLTDTVAITEASLAAWLVRRIARPMEADPAEIACDQPFATLGCDSLELIEIAEDLSRHLGIEVDPVVMWEYPSVRELSSFLARDGQRNPAERAEERSSLVSLK